METYQMTKPAQIVWCSVVNPRPERKDAQNRVFKSAYEATWVFPPDHPDWVAIKKMLRANAPAGVASPTFPVDDGTVVADAAKAKDRDREWARGKVLFTAKSGVLKLDGSPLVPPRLVVINNGNYVEHTERAVATPFFYSGVLAIGTFNFVSYTGMGGGVAVYLNEVLSMNNGERIAGGLDPETKYGDVAKFSSYTGHVSSVDPTAGIGSLV